MVYSQLITKTNLTLALILCPKPKHNPNPYSNSCPNPNPKLNPNYQNELTATLVAGLLHAIYTFDNKLSLQY